MRPRILLTILFTALFVIFSGCGTTPNCPTCGTTINGAYTIINVVPVPEHNSSGEPGGPFNSFDISWISTPPSGGLSGSNNLDYISDRIGLAVQVIDTAQDVAVNSIQGSNAVSGAGNGASPCATDPATGFDVIPPIVDVFGNFTRYGCRTDMTKLGGATAPTFHLITGFGANHNFGGFPGAQCCASRANGVNPMSGPDGLEVSADGNTLFVGNGDASVAGVRPDHHEPQCKSTTHSTHHSCDYTHWVSAQITMARRASLDASPPGTAKPDPLRIVETIAPMKCRLTTFIRFSQSSTGIRDCPSLRLSICRVSWRGIPQTRSSASTVCRLIRLWLMAPTRRASIPQLILFKGRVRACPRRSVGPGSRRLVQPPQLHSRADLLRRRRRVGLGRNWTQYPPTPVDTVGGTFPCPDPSNPHVFSGVSGSAAADGPWAFSGLARPLAVFPTPSPAITVPSLTRT